MRCLLCTKMLRKNNKYNICSNCSGRSVGSLIRDGIIKLSVGLKINQGLTSLNLLYNNITAGVISLADVLKVNKTITNLDLTHNIIGNSEAKNLFQALKENRTLNILNLSDNNIWNIDTDNLIEILKENYSLEYLHMRHNGCENDLSKIYSMLEQNRNNKMIKAARK